MWRFARIFWLLGGSGSTHSHQAAQSDLGLNSLELISDQFLIF